MIEDTTNKNIPASGGPEDQLNALYDLLASRIRQDSQNKKRLTSMAAVTRLAAEPGKVRAFINALPARESCKDIKLAIATNGDVYLYSEMHLNRQDAEKYLFLEEVNLQIVERVREDSQKKLELTKVNALGILIPGAEPDRVDRHLLLLLDDERYPDIHLVSNSRSTRYLYSDRFMTATYAGVLASAQAADPLATIAAVVREESRIYPRPTAVSVFAAPVFNIDPAEIERYADELTKKPEFADIKTCVASTGALYLYSEAYLGRDWVRATVEWEEVGRALNP